MFFCCISHTELFAVILFACHNGKGPLMVSRFLAVSQLDLMTLFLDWSISVLNSASAPSSLTNLESFLEH